MLGGVTISTHSHTIIHFKFNSSHQRRTSSLRFNYTGQEEEEAERERRFFNNDNIFKCKGMRRQRSLSSVVVFVVFDFGHWEEQQQEEEERRNDLI